MVFHNVTRRELLKLGGTAAAAELASWLLHGCGGSSSGISPIPSACSKLTDIKHVVIIVQENRSFDHYFGSYRGVRGFSDTSMA
jgi:phospholipase C